MSKIEWPSQEDMCEAIGYLACPGVVNKIEATVPADRVEKFKEKYKGMYSDEYPYIVKKGTKYGDQLRLYLNDNDGCPSFLREQLDATYGVRLNDTSFISFIIRSFGFRITNSPQESSIIIEKAKFLSEKEYKAFLKGYNKHNEFMDSLSESLTSDSVIAPVLVECPEVKTGKKKKATRREDSNNSSFTKEQLQSIGWLGEKYIYMLLMNRNKELLERIAADKKPYNVVWFNEGFETDDNWKDKSVGEGCDLIVEMENDRIMIEVKTSKKDGKLFTMTHNEMVTMQEMGDRYYILKVNWIERLLHNQSPELIVYTNPFDTIFKPAQIKEATFYVRS
ncbi:MAG: DUF3883 domain-containing protein [Lachnospiraceae bacterium]|jgi:hypothetical protein|nr:DUF3883 domain-containing protein [Lachnospiraceae bacterium]